MATLHRTPIRIQASLPNARKYTKYIKHKKEIPITREEKKEYFAQNDYCYEHVEKYYTVIREQLEKNNHLEDLNKKIHIIYAACFPIISLISEGNKDPFS
jgi:DNA-directed RNA polymerase beta subunit